MIDLNRLKEESTPVKFKLSRWIGTYWFQLIVGLFVFQIYQNRKIELVVHTNSINPVELIAQTSSFKISNLDSSKPTYSTFSTIAHFEPKKPVKKWASSDFGNLSFVLNPDMAETKQVDEKIVQEKLSNCRNYVKRYKKAAIIEMKKYGVPASITLAQGLLESNAGSSKLAKESNNHFGIKCRSKCRGCTCRNYADDDIYDMFRVFDSSWESFREHSLLLQISRYNHLKKHGTKDYKSWAVGLKQSGYATDKNYHNKLIKIIEFLDLDQFDQ